MSKEAPAWKIPLAMDLSEWLGEHVNGWTLDQGVTLEKVIYPHILAAEQRGFQAGVNKTGDSVGKLREQLKTAEQKGRQQALTSFVCGACGHRVGWVDCPTGGWWAHEVHPSDNHDATECVPESGNDS